MVSILKLSSPGLECLNIAQPERDKYVYENKLFCLSLIVLSVLVNKLQKLHLLYNHFEKHVNLSKYFEFIKHAPHPDYELHYKVEETG